jgi:hypothetical protein
MVELMKWTRQARPVQAILRHVPVFQAYIGLEFFRHAQKTNRRVPDMYRRKGMQQNTNPMKEKSENILLEVVMIVIADGIMTGEWLS